LKVENGIAGEARDLCRDLADGAALTTGELLQDALQGTTMENIDSHSRAEIVRTILSSRQRQERALPIQNDRPRK